MAYRKKEGDWRVLALSLLLVLGIGIVLIFLKPTFTGFAVNIISESSTNSYEFSAGVFQNTKFDSGEKAVVLDNSTSGSYTSQVFDSGENVVWENVVYTSDLPPDSSLTFYARSCDDSNCDVESFNVISPPTLDLSGRYFQYKVDMTASLSSPKLYEVNLSYSIPSFYVNVESPQVTSYNIQSVLIKISSNAPNVWFYNGTANETYTGEVYRTFSEGQHTIYAGAGDLSGGNQNSTSVTFSVSLPQQPYCGDASCNSNEDCSSCPSDCGQCTTTEETTEAATTEESAGEEESSNIQVPVTGQATNTESSECVSEWQCEDWSECVEEEQTRVCNDVNECGSEEGKPLTLQTCKPAESCFDELKNQDEAGIDCGGVCENRCSIFTIVGNAVTGPIGSGKQFLQEKVFANKTRTFIILEVVVALIVGFFAFRFFSRKKIFFKFNVSNKQASDD